MGSFTERSSFVFFVFYYTLRAIYCLNDINFHRLDKKQLNFFDMYLQNKRTRIGNITFLREENSMKERTSCLFGMKVNVLNMVTMVISYF